MYNNIYSKNGTYCFNKIKPTSNSEGLPPPFQEAMRQPIHSYYLRYM